MAETVSFKVYLIREENANDAKPEVRRFGIDRDVVTSFVYLTEKLQTVFADLRSKRFTISWQDKDGDDVVISSDEELKIALSETSDENVRILHVTLHSEYPANTFAPNKEHPSQIDHLGVVCDACEKSICGFRYKCIQCPDFDLCADCENKGFHPEHCMIRSAVPLMWKPHFQRRLAHHMNKFAKKSGGHAFGRRGEPGEYPHKRGKYHEGSHEGPRGGHHGGHRGRCGERSSWLDTLAAYMNEWAYLPGEGECPMRNRSAQRTDGESDSDKEKNGRGQEKPSGDLPTEFLRDIGQNLANLLDPLGINVQVSPESPDTPQTSAAASSGSNGNRPESSSTQKFPGQGKKLVESKPAPDPAPSAPVGGPSASTDRQSIEHEGWMLLNRRDNSPAPAVLPGNNSSNEPMETEVTTNGAAGHVPISTPATIITPNQIYPELPKPTETPQPLYHPDPKIQRSVVAMMQMGFSNDGGWLTQLLAAKNGEISKVLDILQPVPSYKK